MMKKVIFFTNIPAPYRITLFNDLERLRIASNRQFDFEVLFMRITESNRQWIVDTNEFAFKYRIGNGFYLPFMGFFLHLNPGLIRHATRSKNEIILGASWNNLNVLLIVLLKRLGLVQNILSIWSEANYLTTRSQKKSVLRDKLRSWVFSSIDGTFIVPGKMSLLSFEKWKIIVKKSLILPNIVSKSLFNSNFIKRHEFHYRPIFLIVAQLVEPIKGILNFIKAIGEENIRIIEIRIIGIGSHERSYKKYVFENNYSDNIHFLGNLRQEEVNIQYEQADIFVLPSFSDQSPLTVVEAINKGLPLIISERCGNHFEALESGKNGYIFDPYDPLDIKNKFELILSQRDQWPSFSAHSKIIAKEKFDNETILTNLIEGLIANDTN